MDLFDYQKEEMLKTSAPLSYRMRPKSLDDYVGQEHIIGKNTLLYRAIKANKLSSLILYGPPGTGKTTLAKIIANNNCFIQLNATTSGVKDIKSAIETSKDNLVLKAQKTVLFVDEIHRFNKSQQDTLLPYVEDGTIILIGATTENPYFEVNNALISRSMIIKLNPLKNKDIKKILINALTDKEKGLGNYNVNIDDESLEFLSNISNGDARMSLNAIEIAVLTTKQNDKGEIVITKDVASQCIQKKFINYDKDGDNHYDTASALIKSIRGSDPDAGLYYLARMLKAGEDPKFIARRLVISASEDIGNADPHALMVATSAMQGVQFVGMPEGRIILAQAVTYLASAQKSNASYLGIKKAYDDVENINIKTIPLHLKDGSYKGSKNLKEGAVYLYPHQYPNSYVEQQYLPDELVGKRYYEPTENGVEGRIKQRLNYLRGEKNE